MKLLIDRMLSYRLIRYLEPHYPGTEHVDRSHKINAGDNEIWNRARRDGFTIVTKDGDFLEIWEKEGWPPKVIKLNLGNCSNEEAAELLIQNKDKVEQFHEDDERGLLEL